MVLLALAAIYNLSPVQQHLGWRVAELMARAKYALRPPARAIFIPQDIASLPASATRRAKTATPVAGAGRAMVPFATPSGEATLVATPAPLPDSVQLSGFQHEYQTWNNCGPATLAMALSYWGWKGDQRPIAVFTKPNPRDKNVMPDELAQFVQNQSRFLAATRVGGDKEMLKRFLAAGLPVIIEKGFEGRDFDGWMGHYVLVTGYRDSEQRFTVQDSYYGPNQSIGYSSLESNWRAFDFTYLLVYPATRQAEVAGILGPHMNEGYNDRSAAEKASDEIDILAGRDLFFAWFNRGTNLVRLGDTADAAAAYDEAFRLYPELPEKQRPWRMMWYQTGPYQAYYSAGRYQDVIRLASTTLDAMSEPVLEESYYWRAMARAALGDQTAAVQDLRSSLKYHPGLQPAIDELRRLGVAP